MALFILTPGLQPLGDFDVLDTDQSSVNGGEVMTLGEASRTITSSEKAAADVLDGYIADQVSEGTPTATRVVAKLADETTEDRKLFYLSDDGTAFYGVLFGSVIGTPVGLTTTGTNLGPHTISGSGKVTLWDKEGLYAVSTSVLSSDVVPTTGNTLDTPLPGELLYREQGTGLLTRATTSGDKIAMFVELASNSSLVTTPARLVGATEVFDRIKIQFLGTGAAAAVA
ncbi:hypothetical protein LCGC14_2107870 [marine sediment metagenome]|uniref:Uncharacterized protein n=1 Tax=marine sediment metagenome TaxID=412755 RepID=A0A0F9H489_9ZZZZ